MSRYGTVWYGTTTDLQNFLLGSCCSQTAVNKPHQCLPACRSCVPVHQQHSGDKSIEVKNSLIQMSPYTVPVIYQVKRELW